MRFLLFLFLTILGVSGCASARPAQAFEVQSVRVGEHPDKFRAVIDVSAPVEFRVFTLAGPDRMVVDVPPLSWAAGGSVQLPKRSGIKGVRHGVLRDDMSRVVFDLKQPVQILSSFILPASPGKPDRIVIDYRLGAASAAGQSSVVPAPAAAASETAVPAPKPVRTAERKKIIVIDAGHGGKDPGATSGKIREKDIVFALAKSLRSKLEAQGFDVRLTRDTNRYIKLYDRVRIARDHGADLFISLHADSIGKPSVRGASVYTLSEKASDAQTAKLAARENKADLIAGVDLSHEDPDVAGILLDLVQRDTMNQSNYFAEKVVKSFKAGGIRLLENPHRSAGFAVLKAPDIPSVLIEAGFVSNRQDAQLLNTSSYRSKLAGTIASAVRTYFDHVDRSGVTR